MFVRPTVQKPELDARSYKEVLPMARKPNYDFERKERERLKNEKKAARANEKVKPPAAPSDQADDAQTKQPSDPGPRSS